MSISLRDRWSTSVLHLSAHIAGKKNGLLTVYGMRSLLNVLLIIGAELLLLVISLPSYVAAQPVLGESGTKEYHLRRALTLGVIGTLFIIWILKLALILTLAGFVNNNQLTKSTSVTETYNQNGNTETLADDVLIAKESAELAPPTVTKIQNTRGQIAFWGTAPAGSVVVFAFTENIGNVSNEVITPKIYTVQADANGRFELWEDASIFDLPKGSYIASASTYDPVRGIKSTQSHTFSFTVTESLWNTLLHSSDTILNILALIVILIGLLMTILVA